jgi:hypothetical protein
MQVDLQAVKTSIDMWTGSLKDDITDAKDFHEAITNTRNDLHEELGLMLQVEAHITKAEIRINQELAEAKIKATQHEFQTVERRQSQSRARKRNRNWRGRDYIMGHVPAPF